jgi:hypothetical protein
MRPERKLGAACQAGSVLWEYIVMVLVALVTWKKKRNLVTKTPTLEKKEKRNTVLWLQEGPGFEGH